MAARMSYRARNVNLTCKFPGDLNRHGFHIIPLSNNGERQDCFCFFSKTPKDRLSQINFKEERFVWETGHTLWVSGLLHKIPSEFTHTIQETLLEDVRG